MLRTFETYLTKKGTVKTQYLPLTTGEPSSHEETWRHLEKKMRDALRLRHTPLSTEKTYLIRSMETFL